MRVIPKHQKGGQFDSFFTTYVPIQIEAPRQSSGSSAQGSSGAQSSEKGRLTEKDFFDMVKDIDGLPNDMNLIVQNLINTFQLSELTGIDPGNLATQYLSNLYQIKVASQNKAAYDTAIENAGKNGSLAEPAISMNGNLIVQNSDGSVSDVDLGTYLSNSDQYRLLTVSNLANMRKYDPQLANNSSVFDIINNSMGFEAFQALIKQATQNLKQSEYSRSGMFSVEGDATRGLELLGTLREDDRVQAMHSVTADGLYKYKIIDKTQKSQIDALTQYMVAVLPDRAKTWAALKLKTPNKNQAAKDLILAYLLSGSSESHTFDIDYLGSMDKVSGTKSGDTSGKSSDDTKMTYLTALQNGYGGRREQRTLNFGNNTNFNVVGTVYGSFLDQDGKTLTHSTLADLMAKTGLSGISNPQSITFGDNVINSNSWSKIAVEDNGGVWAVLPCIKEGTVVTPNFQLMSKFNNVVQEVINELGDNSTPEQKQTLLEKKLQGEPDLQELLTMSGHLDQSKVQAFFIVDGLASDRNFSFKNSNGSDISGESNPLIWATDNKEDLDYFKSVTGDEFDEDSLLPGDWFGMYDTLYRSKVFIPIQTNNRLAAIIFSGQKIKDSNARTIEGEYQRYQISNQMNIPSSKYLYQ